MKIDLDDVFPDRISDETAATVAEVLAEMLMCWETHYLAQILRHNTSQHNLYDPDAPWRSLPQNPAKTSPSR